MYTIIGGTLTPGLDLTIRGELPVSDDKVQANARHARTLGLKTYRSWQTDKHRLAVVGGGPSINEHVEDLQKWDGDVWAINGAWKWCKDRGIEATFFACDPHPISAQWAEGATTALLENSCDPSVFELLKGAEVYTYDADPQSKGGIVGYASTASCAPHLAIRMGYREVTFFGCESSYHPNATHAYMDEARKEEMIIRCNGGEYLTAPDLFLQVVGLSKFIREVPEFLKEKSGGLLRAMVNNPEMHIHWISEGLAATLEKPDHKPLVSPAYKGKKVSGAVAMADNLDAFGLTERDVA